jgi:hypothetical protein
MSHLYETSVEIDDEDIDLVRAPDELVVLFGGRENYENEGLARGIRILPAEVKGKVEPGYSGSFNGLTGAGYSPEGDEVTDLCVDVVIQDARGDLHRFNGSLILSYAFRVNRWTSNTSCKFVAFPNYDAATIRRGCVP